MSSAGSACRTGPCILTPQGATSSATDLMRVRPRRRGKGVQMVRIKKGGSSGLGELTPSVFAFCFSFSSFLCYTTQCNAMQCHCVSAFCTLQSPHNYLLLHYNTYAMSMPSASLSCVHGSKSDRALRHDASIRFKITPIFAF